MGPKLHGVRPSQAPCSLGSEFPSPKSRRSLLWGILLGRVVRGDPTDMEADRSSDRLSSKSSSRASWQRCQSQKSGVVSLSCFFRVPFWGVALKGHQGIPFFGPVILTHSVPLFFEG